MKTMWVLVGSAVIVLLLSLALLQFVGGGVRVEPAVGSLGSR
jgi:hypothetical protein